ncbi:hypothetical protein ABDK56_06520 [Sphingomonas sp. ASV193]|uniref:hypothetical protein n=1 Tax=Sphingomonas sp. ASV193 TaxID=3144405 RepID=UPI0032E85930
MKRTLALATLLSLLGACARVGPLEPAPGRSMPVKPRMALTTPTVDQLLAYTTQARPQRVDELLTRNKPRESDRFDLPPPAAGFTPAAPAVATKPAPVTTGPDTADQPN